MEFLSILWGEPDDDDDGNVQHIGDHGLTIEDVEYVLCDVDTIRVVTAYDVPEY